MTDLTELKRLAEAATPGPWTYRGPPSNGYSTFVGCFEGANGTVICDFGDSETYYPSEGAPPEPDDAAFIAAANPATVLSLIAQIEHLTAEREKDREALARCSNALQRLHTDIEALMADSTGVVGLHMNGDVATWEDLGEGGRFSDWLGDPMWAARNAWRDARARLEDTHD